MEDKILQKFFEHDRWIYAIEKGIDKDIDKADLYKLTKPEVRVKMCEAIRRGEYEIAPPHTAQIPKDNGEFRTVYVNEPIDRVFLSIANDLLFELMPEMVHPRCRSYQKGIGCGEIVKEISRKICETQGEEYLDACHRDAVYLFAEIPTMNGCHLITKPFNLQKFKEKFPEIDVHKNNPTILYIPNSLII